ncbi:transcription factor doublesex [Augochlora pura]
MDGMQSVRADLCAGEINRPSETDVSAGGRSVANYDIRTMRFWNEFGMLQPSRHCCTGFTDPTGAPTYEGHVPHIGVAPPPSAIDLGFLPHTLNSHIPATRVPSFRPDTPPEHSAT